MISIKSKLSVILRQALKDSGVKSWIRCNTSASKWTMNERQFEDIGVDSYEQLITTEDVKKKIELILSEYEYEKYTTLRVPSTITAHAMKELITISDTIERHKMYRFLYTKEMHRKKDQMKRKEVSEKYWKEKNEIYSAIDCQRTGIWDNENQLVYGLWHNTVFSKIMKTSISRLQNHRLRRAALFGQQLVIDLAFDEYMKLYETRLLLKQLSIIYNYNKYKTTEPFDLHFTDCNPKSHSMQEMSRYFPNYKSPQFMATLHTKSYLDVFPNERLVYLTPHSDYVLKKFNDNDIYIIGGIIDKFSHEPITHLKAHKQGIRTARLPLDENVLWKTGSKSLCLNHIVSILHDIKMTGDWRTVLRNNIPQRKQKNIEEIAYEDSLRRQKYNRYVRQRGNDRFI